MPSPCSLLLEVFKSALEYDLADEVVDFEISSDKAHIHPWLMPLRYYGEQEIDPVSCAVSIGTIEVGVIDVPQIEGDQTSGWMTERIFSVFGRRCRLRRWVDDVLGWVTIADGPAGTPKLDTSYSAYRWSIRDTREIERKLTAFTNGGTTAILPRGAVNGFGAYEDENGDPQWLLPPMTQGIVGEMSILELGDGSGLYSGFVIFNDKFDFDVPFGEAPELLDADLAIDEDGEKAIASATFDSLNHVHRNADILWRLSGSGGPWNAARPSIPSPYSLALGDVIGVTLAGEEARAVLSVVLFLQDGIPAGFPANGAAVEVIVRHRGAASPSYPYYFEGTAGELLAALYDGTLALPPSVAGSLYDPAGLETIGASLASRIRYDAAALALMTMPVVLRQTEPVEDGRDWAEAKVYGPSGQIPVLDDDGRISPLTRNRPDDLTGLANITNAIAEPSPDWNAGERVVTEVHYSYKRYWVPSGFGAASVEIQPDGLAVRDVSLGFQDVESEALHNAQPAMFDASAFSAIGDSDGAAREGIPETASLLAQEGRFEVLARYRNGTQSFGVAVPREEIPTLRAGQYVKWDLSWLPHRETGVRGGPSGDEAAAQVLAIRDDDCAWRSLLLEESSVALPPGYYSDLDKTEDEPQPGYYSDLGLSSDTEGGS